MRVFVNLDSLGKAASEPWKYWKKELSKMGYVKE